MMRVVHKEIGKEGPDVFRRAFIPHGAIRANGEGLLGMERVPLLPEKLADRDRVVRGRGSVKPDDVGE